MGPRNAHERKRGILAVRGVLEDELKQADRSLAVAKAREQEPAAIARPVQQRAGNAILFADDLVEFGGVRITAHDFLKGPERLDILMTRQTDVAGVVKGVGRVDGIGVALGDLLIDAQRLAVALAFLRGPRPVHHRKRVPAILPGKARGEAALDPPAAFRRPDQLGYQPHGNEEQGDGCEQKRATFEQRGEQHGQEGLRANQRRPIGQARPEPCRRRRFSRPSKWGAPSGLRPGPERGRGRDAAVVEADDEAVQKEGGSFVVVSVMDGAPGAG